MSLLRKILISSRKIDNWNYSVNICCFIEYVVCGCFTVPLTTFVRIELASAPTSCVPYLLSCLMYTASSFYSSILHTLLISPTTRLPQHKSRPSRWFNPRTFSQWHAWAVYPIERHLRWNEVGCVDRVDIVTVTMRMCLVMWGYKATNFDSFMTV